MIYSYLKFNYCSFQEVSLCFQAFNYCQYFFFSVSLNDFKMKATSLHNLSEHFIESTPPIAQFEASASTLNSLSKSEDTSTGLVVKILLSLLNAYCCSCPHCHFTSFLINIFIGLATQAKSLMNLLQQFVRPKNFLTSFMVLANLILHLSFPSLFLFHWVL